MGSEVEGARPARRRRSAGGSRSSPPNPKKGSLVGMEFLRPDCMSLIKGTVRILARRGGPDTTPEKLHKVFQKETGSKVSIRTFRAWLKELGFIEARFMVIPDEFTADRPEPRIPIVSYNPPTKQDIQMDLPFDGQMNPPVGALHAGGGFPTRPDPRMGGIVEARSPEED